MTIETPVPIRSEFEDNLELQGAVDDFVLRLAEAVDRIQDAEAENDLPQVTLRCLALAGEARAHGYKSLADLAGATCHASQEEKRDAVEDHLRLLTQISCRIRLGHRGAA